MFVNFDTVFKPPIDWSKVELTSNPPCKTCEHKITLRELYPGNTWDDPVECESCVKRWNYIVDCLEKLAWYEEREKVNESISE